MANVWAIYTDVFYSKAEDLKEQRAFEGRVTGSFSVPTVNVVSALRVNVGCSITDY